MRRGEAFVAIELAAGERHEMRRVQPRVLRVDRDEHLDDVIFGQAVEDHRRHGERLVAEALDVGVQREQPVLAVDRAQDAFALRHLQRARASDPASTGSNLQRLVAGDDDRAGDRRQVARLAALLVVLHQLVDFLADDLALIRLLAGRDAALEQIPVHLARTARRLLAAAADRLALLAVAEDLEPDELVDVAGGERGLVELHPELLHPNGGDADHGDESCICGRNAEKSPANLIVGSAGKATPPPSPPATCCPVDT